MILSNFRIKLLSIVGICIISIQVTSCTRTYISEEQSIRLPKSEFENKLDRTAKHLSMSTISDSNSINIVSGTDTCKISYFKTVDSLEYIKARYPLYSRVLLPLRIVDGGMPNSKNVSRSKAIAYPLLILNIYPYSLYTENLIEYNIGGQHRDNWPLIVAGVMDLTLTLNFAYGTILIANNGYEDMQRKNEYLISAGYYLLTRIFGIMELRREVQIFEKVYAIEVNGNSLNVDF